MTALTGVTMTAATGLWQGWAAAFFTCLGCVTVLVGLLVTRSRAQALPGSRTSRRKT